MGQHEACQPSRGYPSMVESVELRTLESLLWGRVIAQTPGNLNPKEPKQYALETIREETLLQRKMEASRHIDRLSGIWCIYSVVDLFLASGLYAAAQVHVHSDRLTVAQWISWFAIFISSRHARSGVAHGAPPPRVWSLSVPHFLTYTRTLRRLPPHGWFTLRRAVALPLALGSAVHRALQRQRLRVRRDSVYQGGKYEFMFLAQAYSSIMACMIHDVVR